MTFEAAKATAESIANSLAPDGHSHAGTVSRGAMTEDGWRVRVELEPPVQRRALHPPKSDYCPLGDLTGESAWESGEKPLHVGIWEIMCDLTEAMEALGDGNPYLSVGALTPQGVPHTAYANGVIKPQGSAMAPCKAGGFSTESQLAAFTDAAAATLEAIKADKPADRNRLIWRQKPDPGRELREDGLYIKIYTRIGWDKSEG